MKKKIKTIAVINLGYVGDVINASCITIELKKAYPDSKLVFITVPKSREVAKYLPGVDEVEIFDKDIEHKGVKIIKWSLNLRRKYNFDMATLLNETFRSGILAFLIGAKKRVGHDSEGRGFLLTHKVPWLQEEKDFKVHISEIYMRNLKAINLYNPDYSFGLNFNQQHIDYINELLKANNVADKELIGLCPCARLTCKDWKIQEAKEFIDFVNQNTGKKVVIIGQESGKQFVENLKKAGCSDFVDLTCQTSMPQLAALVKKFNIFVSVDTAPMHLGIALNVPTIGLFVQPNFGKWWYEKSEKNKLIYQNPLKAEKVIAEFKNLEDKITVMPSCNQCSIKSPLPNPPLKGRE
ncbi:MAG TPA: glycosyltransferase family 9 protein [Candidatus Gastranaerophilales bacterium]|nr:glycosyltransferase family 9 protein [Candidatus Gastranaerophilales bacterium]